MSRYIDADALKSKLEGVLKDCAGTGLFSIDSLILIADTLQMIKTEPTADVQEVKHGRWIRTGWQRGGYGKPKTEIEYKCSECKRNKIYKRKTQKLPNYCGNCGAKMDLEEEQ